MEREALRAGPLEARESDAGPRALQLVPVVVHEDGHVVDAGALDRVATLTQPLHVAAVVVAVVRDPESRSVTHLAHLQLAGLPPDDIRPAGGYVTRLQVQRHVTQQLLGDLSLLDRLVDALGVTQQAHLHSMKSRVKPG